MDFIQKMKQDIQDNADRNSDIERAILDANATVTTLVENADFIQKMESQMESSDSDAVFFSKNAHCLDAHELDPENETKVFEASMNRKDLENQQLAVFAAIFFGYMEDLQYELNVGHGVDLNGQLLDSRNRTCADFAAVMGRLDMVQLILDRGGTFEVFSRSVMMPLARERDAFRTKGNEE
jgi:antitoxin component HigA of HigAB toxin-antitoxin module